MCENVSRVLAVYSQVARKSIYHARQHHNILNCACFVHQIFKKKIYSSLTCLFRFIKAKRTSYVCYIFISLVSSHHSIIA